MKQIPPLKDLEGVLLLPTFFLLTNSCQQSSNFYFDHHMKVIGHQTIGDCMTDRIDIFFPLSEKIMIISIFTEQIITTVCVVVDMVGVAL